MSLNIAENHFPSLQEVVYGHYLARFTRNWPKVKLGHIGICLNIAPSRIWSLFAPIHMKYWAQVKLGQVKIGSNMAQNHYPSFQEVIW